jgi:hypothetical protein
MSYATGRVGEYDRSEEFGTPLADGPPTVCVVPGLGVNDIAYCDTSGRLHELWRDTQWFTVRRTSRLPPTLRHPCADFVAIHESGPGTFALFKMTHRRVGLCRVQETNGWVPDRA